MDVGHISFFLEKFVYFEKHPLADFLLAKDFYLVEVEEIRDRFILNVWENDQGNIFDFERLENEIGKTFIMGEL